MTQIVSIAKKKKKRSIESIFKWSITELNKTAELFEKRKRDIVLETARRLDEETDIEKNKICQEISKRLEGYVHADYVRQVLKYLPEFKDQKQQQRAKSGREISAGHSQTEQSQVQEHESSTSSNEPSNTTEQVQQQQPPPPQRHHSLSNNQVTQAMTQSEGRSGYLNEEHECYKDTRIKELEVEVEKLMTQIKSLQEKLKKEKAK
jgi:hypothetical protein